MSGGYLQLGSASAARDRRANRQGLRDAPPGTGELHERKMGQLSGQPRDEHWQLYEETRQRWSNADLDFTHEGGESFRQVRRRVMPVFEELACTYWGRTIIVVAHGIVIRVAFCHWPMTTPASSARFPSTTCGSMTSDAASRLAAGSLGGQPASFVPGFKPSQKPASGPAW